MTASLIRIAICFGRHPERTVDVLDYGVDLAIAESVHPAPLHTDREAGDRAVSHPSFGHRVDPRDELSAPYDLAIGSHWYDEAPSERAYIWVSHDSEQAQRVAPRELRIVDGGLEVAR